ncbi:EF-hand domain-containing protein [Beijerinckia indica]|uniref:EF-hand domain-containing protein n=1 Tax=Beijerinckia indica subsp. indica (strain ATCC 9039 / DSM 1715 / NCIMB 8712) TaxID=395963 RepID=B2ICJ0_BEII9|nr:EF-hand domain-containing protein [Beijerinckia indica]ACB93879.1 conserved hypothetical protein [Beijerinckia indica subsp. indica ATCC 9039]
MTFLPFGKSASGKNVFRILLLACALTALSRPSVAASLLERYDANGNGVLDAEEAKDAAEDSFDDIDKDDTDTLDREEIGFRLTDAEFAAADLDHDGVLSEYEYIALVKNRFEKADKDHDGSLSQAELATRAGQAFLRVLQ